MTRTKAKPGRAIKKARPEIAQATMTVEEFCKSHGMSRPFLYGLLRDGMGPKTMKLKKRRWISFEAAAAWRAERAEMSETAE